MYITSHSLGALAVLLSLATASVYDGLNFGYEFGSAYDPREATIASTHHALFTGLTDCRNIVSSFISRIETLNNYTNAIISLDPTSLETADRLDEALKGGNATTGPLFCIPILLKDNYDTKDVPTTGGCLELKSSRPSEDAPSVKALKDAGAIVLGKANLHELALEGISVSSLGGQTVNPYDSSRTPGGSSGGSAAAVASSFSIFATGTDTVNSLRSPPSANSLFSVRPTRGLISRAGVIPISYTQDVLGPIGRCIHDIAIALTVMASVGYDPADNATALVPASVRDISYAANLESGSLKGLRFGILEGFFNRTPSTETTPVNDAMAAMQARLEAAGATVVPITESLYNTTAIAALDTQRYEYRQLLSSYLQNPSLGGAHPGSMPDLYRSNASSFLVLPAQYEYVNTALVSSTGNASYATIQSGIRNLTLALQATFAQNAVDALIYPEQKNLVVPIGSPSQSGRNGILAALTGFPVVTVPAGFSSPTPTAPIGVPIGMEILGQPWTEEFLLQTGYKIEQLFKVRCAPVWAREAVPIKNYEHVPVIVPDRSNIPAVYPLGRL